MLQPVVLHLEQYCSVNKSYLLRQGIGGEGGIDFPYPLLPFHPFSTRISDLSEQYWHLEFNTKSVDREKIKGERFYNTFLFPYITIFDEEIISINKSK